jgi:hypothetical protein
MTPPKKFDATRYRVSSLLKIAMLPNFPMQRPAVKALRAANQKLTNGLLCLTYTVAFSILPLQKPNK